MYIRNRRRGHSSIGRRVNTLPLRRDELDNIIGEGGDRNCIWELRMSLNALTTLCELLQIQGGLDKDGHVGIGEQVATFLIILAHYTKNQAYKLGSICLVKLLVGIFTRYCVQFCVSKVSYLQRHTLYWKIV
ncbi:hypothetical protein Ahy_A09g045510 [Arachis hypogaea]|uniref:DUF8040 domain-containing protein n=1 Tax=Arachis hypogaea TaxID=3818 RepID=A0A445BMG0_ARAHY|nr:hypothetical protein Ahy_A09g045510 [Arachis hypogaea]